MLGGPEPHNRAERRRAQRALKRQQSGLLDFHRDCGGAFGVQIVRAEAALWLFTLDPLFRGAVLQWVDGADDVRPQCADCDVELTTSHPPIDWVLLIPLRDDPQMVSTLGLCPDCSVRLADDDALLAALEPRLQTTWSALRVLDPGAFVVEGGCA